MFTLYERTRPSSFSLDFRPLRRACVLLINDRAPSTRWRKLTATTAFPYWPPPLLALRLLSAKGHDPAVSPSTSVLVWRACVLLINDRAPSTRWRRRTATTIFFNNGTHQLSKFWHLANFLAASSTQKALSHPQKRTFAGKPLSVSVQILGLSQLFGCLKHPKSFISPSKTHFCRETPVRLSPDFGT
jgi:hypothetical protein